MFELSSKNIGKKLKIISTILTIIGTIVGIIGSIISQFSSPIAGSILSLIGYGTLLVSSEANLLVTFFYSNNDIGKLISSKTDNQLALEMMKGGSINTQHEINKYMFWIKSLCCLGCPIIAVIGLGYIGCSIASAPKWVTIFLSAVITIIGLGSTVWTTLLKSRILTPLQKKLGKCKTKINHDMKINNDDLKKKNILLTQLINLKIKYETRKLLSSHANYLFLFKDIKEDELTSLDIYNNIEDLKFIQEILPLKFEQLVTVEFGGNIPSNAAEELLKFKESVKKINDAEAITDDNITDFKKQDESKKINENIIIEENPSNKKNNGVNIINPKEQVIEKKCTQEDIKLSNHRNNFSNENKDANELEKKKENIQFGNKNN
jgi:hypothetical protein